jgi:prephenate dehydratase
VSLSNHKTRVAFQGERGAFSEEAAIKLLGTDIELVPRRTFDDLYSSFREGVADLLLAPIENSIAGEVKASADLLRQSELKIIDEVSIPIAQHLIACPGSDFSSIEEVQSHPVALAQCSNFFKANPQLKQIVSDDTAGSVAQVLHAGEKHRAAIAGQRAAQLYGGVIIRENIQDTSDNTTRFLLLTNNTKEIES